MEGVTLSGTLQLPKDDYKSGMIRKGSSVSKRSFSDLSAAEVNSQKAKVQIAGLGSNKEFGTQGGLSEHSSKFKGEATPAEVRQNEQRRQAESIGGSRGDKTTTERSKRDKNKSIRSEQIKGTIGKSPIARFVESKSHSESDSFLEQTSENSSELRIEDGKPIFVENRATDRKFNNDFRRGSVAGKLSKMDFVSKSNMNELERHLIKKREGQPMSDQLKLPKEPKSDNLLRLLSLAEDSTKPHNALPSTTNNKTATDAQTKRLLLKNSQNSLSQVSSQYANYMKNQEPRVKIIDHLGKIVGFLRPSVIRSKFGKHLVERPLPENIHPDDTIVYELNEQRTEIVRKPVPRERCQPNDRLKEKIKMEWKYYLPNRLNLYELEAEILKEINEEEKLKNAPKHTNVEMSGHKENIIFSRTNNNLPVSLTHIPDLRSKLEMFVLLWLKENLKLQNDQVEALLHSDDLRKVFFIKNPEIIELVLDTVLKRPHLYAKVKDYLYGRLKDEAVEVLAELDKKIKKELEVEEKKVGSNQSKRSYSTERTEATLDKETSGKLKTITFGIAESQIPKLNFNKVKLGAPELPLTSKIPNPAKKNPTFLIHPTARQSFYDTIRSTSNSFLTPSATLTTRSSCAPPHPLKSPARTLSRAILSQLKNNSISPAEIGQLGLLASQLGAASSTGKLEGDLVWVSALARVIEGSSVYGVRSEDRERRFGYYRQVVEAQRQQRKVFELRSGQELYCRVVKALSWIGFVKPDNTILYYNFTTGDQTDQISKPELDLMSRHYNYLPHN
jgi:hypothetical protein